MEGNIVFGHELVQVHLGGDTGRVPELPSKEPAQVTSLLTSHPTDRLTETAYLFWILPPSLPLVCVVGCDGHIANSSIKPDIKYLVLKTFQGHRSSPFEVSGDASWLEAVSKPGTNNKPGIGCPVTARQRLPQPVL